MSRPGRLRAYEEILDRSGVVKLLDSFLPAGGRPRRLSTKAVLLAVMAAFDEGRPAHLVAAHEALGHLPVGDQLRLRAAWFGPGGMQRATYRQFSDTFSVIVHSIDPSPVPSFRDVPEALRASHLAAARAGVDLEGARQRLEKVTDQLLEASVPAAYKSASRSFAVDWTDHESFARPRRREDPQPSSDPDASFGHAKRNAPGAKDYLFYGYYAQVATMVADLGASQVPELVRRIAFCSPRSDPAAVMAATLARAAASGLALGEVICDCGYSNGSPAHFAGPLRRAGARLVMDLHPDDRGPHGTFSGAILCNGNLYCPMTPPALLGLGPLRRGADREETARHDEACAELARYKFSRLSGPDGDGYERLVCPAAARRVRCPLKSPSMALCYERPSVLLPPECPPVCCRQLSITLPPQVNEKTRQAHDYPSAAWRASYNRRTASERSFARAADPSRGGVRRGWSRLFGVAKNTLLYALYTVVMNIRVLESFERRQARAETAEPIRRRRRRRLGAEPSGEEAVGEVAVSPD